MAKKSELLQDRVRGGIRFAIALVTTMRRALLATAALAAGTAIIAASYVHRRAAVAAETAAVRGQAPPVEGAKDPGAPGAGSADPDARAAQASRRPRAPEATVYVDGKPVAILRAVELPPGLTTRDVTTKWGKEPRYLVGDYLAALHVDAKRVKALHFYGGSRVVMIDGDDFRRAGGELGFTFTLKDRGKVNMHFPGGLPVNTTIDLMTNLAIYIDKEPPTMHRDGWGDYVALADGKPIDGMPYATPEQLKGTRVYVDGQLVGIVKRKLLPNDVLVGEVGKSTTFSLRKYLATIGVRIADGTGIVDAKDASPVGAVVGGGAKDQGKDAKIGKVKAVDLLSDDDLVERIDPAAWARDVDSLTFALPTHSRGQIVMARPRLDDAKARVSSVQIFIQSEPPKRWLAPPEVVAMADDPQADSRRADETESPL